MRVLSILFVYLLTALVPAQALEILPGTDITEVIRAMKKAHYPENGLDMGASDPGNGLEMWSVDQGLLIVVYSMTSHKVKSIGFHLSDERPKATQKTFDLSVIRFDTNSGRMEIKTRQPKG